MHAFGLLIGAPIAGATKDTPNDGPTVLHALDVDAVAKLAWKGGTITAPCGQTDVHFVFAVASEDEPEQRPILWPPPVAACRRYDLERCRACWEATGKKRPGDHWVRRWERKHGTTEALR